MITLFISHYGSSSTNSCCTILHTYRRNLLMCQTIGYPINFADGGCDLDCLCQFGYKVSSKTTVKMYFMKFSWRQAFVLRMNQFLITTKLYTITYTTHQTLRTMWQCKNLYICNAYIIVHNFNDIENWGMHCLNTVHNIWSMHTSNFTKIFMFRLMKTFQVKMAIGIANTLTDIC